MKVPASWQDKRQKVIPTRWPGSRAPVRTCVVILGAVSQILLLLEHKLREGEVVGHLNRVLGQPLKDQVIHGVTDYGQNKEEGEGFETEPMSSGDEFCPDFLDDEQQISFSLFCRHLFSSSPSVCCLLLHFRSRINSRVCVQIRPIFLESVSTISEKAVEYHQQKLREQKVFFEYVEYSWVCKRIFKENNADNCEITKKRIHTPFYIKHGTLNVKKSCYKSCIVFVEHSIQALNVNCHC